MKRTLLITLLIATMLSVQAQKVWTLDQCIDYALEHNLDIRKSQLAQQQAEYQYKASKSAWLPTLNANAGEYFGFGQSPSYTGVYVSDNSSSSSFGANLSLPLFQGLNLYNTTQANALNLQASEKDYDAAKLNLKVSVMGFYMQVLYGKEQVEIARRQTELSAEQLQKTQQLYENGRIAEADVYESQAQLALDQSTLTQAETDLSLRLLTLMHTSHHCYCFDEPTRHGSRPLALAKEPLRPESQQVSMVSHAGFLCRLFQRTLPLFRRKLPQHAHQRTIETQ